MGIGWLSVSQAAESAKVSRQYIRKLIAHGVIHAMRVGTFWIVEVRSFYVWKIQRENRR